MRIRTAFLVLFAAAASSQGGSGRLVVTLQPGELVVQGESLQMEGFNLTGTPGMPLLPVRTVHYLLPPGARAVSAEILDSSTRTLPGSHTLQHSKGIFILPGIPGDQISRYNLNLGEELLETLQESMASVTPYPSSPVRLTAAGTLRKYSYASLTFYPVAYTASTGEIILVEDVTVAINYETPEGGSREADHFQSLLSDCLADDQASDLFVNHTMFSHLYHTETTLNSRETHNLIVITTDQLAPAVVNSDFPQWKETLGYNMKTVLISDSEISSQPGSDLAEQIRNFLRSYYGPWGIEHVLLVGDYETVPMRICYPDSGYHVYNPSNPGLVAPGTPTDAYYADLSYPDSESWDLDGDGYPGEYNQDAPDFLAEVSVGRIPVNSPARITETLNRSVAFEQAQGSWKNSVLHVGTILFFENQNHGGGPLVDGAVLLDSMETGLMTGMNITHMSEQWGLQKSLFPWPAASEVAFSSSWRNGEFGVVNWSGHGWPNGAARSVWAWDDGDGVPESANGEIQSLYFINVESTVLENDRPSVMFAISCDVGYPEPNPWGNSGIDLLTDPDWGASVGVVSAARPAAVSGDWINEPGGTEQICFEFNRYLIQEGNTTGEALYNGKFHATSVYGWPLVYEYMNLYNFNLFGDPTLELAGFETGIEGEQGEASSGIQLLVTSPVSANGSVMISLQQAGEVEISIYDITGRRVAVLLDQMLGAGLHQVDLNCDLPDGGYLILGEADGCRDTAKLVILR